GGGAAPGALTGPGGVQLAAPPGSTPVPGTVVVTPAPAAPQGAGANNPPTPSLVAPQPTASPGPAATTPTTSPGLGQAQIIISPPPTMRVGGGPYTVPISVTNA